MNQSYSQAVNQSIQEAQEVKAIQNGWTLLKKGKYVSLFTQKYKDYLPPLVKIEATIPSNLQSVSKYYFENTATIAKIRENQCAGIDTLEILDQDNAISLIKLKQFETLPAAELLHLKHRATLSPNEVLLVGTHIDDHPKHPKLPNVDRAQTILNALFITQQDAKNTSIKVFSLNELKVAPSASLLEKLIESLVSDHDQDIEYILSH